MMLAMPKKLNEEFKTKHFINVGTSSLDKTDSRTRKVNLHSGGVSYTTVTPDDIRKGNNLGRVVKSIS